MTKYRKRPVEIEAYKFNGSSTDIPMIRDWMEGGPCPQRGGLRTSDMNNMVIHTLEGDMVAQPGDYIIKGVAGEFYPCKPDIFTATYEEVIQQCDDPDCSMQSRQHTTIDHEGEA